MQDAATLETFRHQLSLTFAHNFQSRRQNRDKLCFFYLLTNHVAYFQHVVNLFMFWGQHNINIVLRLVLFS